MKIVTRLLFGTFFVWLMPFSSLLSMQTTMPSIDIFKKNIKYEIDNLRKIEAELMSINQNMQAIPFSEKKEKCDLISQKLFAFNNSLSHILTYLPAKDFDIRNILIDIDAILMDDQTLIDERLENLNLYQKALAPLLEEHGEFSRFLNFHHEPLFLSINFFCTELSIKSVTSKDTIENIINALQTHYTILTNRIKFLNEKQKVNFITFLDTILNKVEEKKNPILNTVEKQPNPILEDSLRKTKTLAMFSLFKTYSINDPNIDQLNFTEVNFIDFLNAKKAELNKGSLATFDALIFTNKEIYEKGRLPIRYLMNDLLKQTRTILINFLKEILAYIDSTEDPKDFSYLKLKAFFYYQILFNIIDGASELTPLAQGLYIAFKSYNPQKPTFDLKQEILNISESAQIKRDEIITNFKKLFTGFDQDLTALRFAMDRDR